MQQHHFDPVTRLYTHSSEAPVNPKKENAFILSAFATFAAIPTIPAGSVAKRTGDSVEGDGWQVLEDNRGTVWDTTSKEAQQHNELGELPANLTKLEPGEFDSWNGSAWAYDIALEVAATLPNVLNAINTACKAEIEGGFTSDALGSTHSYESELEDQLNLSGNIQRAKDVLQKCTDALNETQYRMHTTTEIHQVGEDLATHKLAQLQKALTLKDQAQTAAQANDLTALNAISW